MKMPNAVICEEIKKTGAISFARFMELALYCPETGYYEKNQDNVGRRGDFITSVSVGSLFGELLAWQFTQWLGEMRDAEGRRRIIEAGAHDGRLAADILSWLEKFQPELLSGIEYWILEPSATRRVWQENTLQKFSPRVRWFADFDDLKSKTGNAKLHGVLFGNELLDAFPVHRFAWSAPERKWFEWGVVLDGDKLVWSRQPERMLPAGGFFAQRPDLAGNLPALQLPSSIHPLPSSLLEVLPDGYIVEVSPGAENWWRSAAGIFESGRLMAIDYGFVAEEQFSPARLQGTLRAYYQHQISDDLLARPGEQDLTAHVNFSAIQQAGEAAGLKTESLSSQPQFLTLILAQAIKAGSFGGLDAKQVRQFQTLTHPEHLGRAFRVLLQSR